MKNKTEIAKNIITAFAVRDTPDLADQLQPCSHKRDWMDESFYRTAYRCVPMVAANTLGWEILNPARFEAMWNGWTEPGGVAIKHLEEKNIKSPRSHFGSGIVTWEIPFLFRTPPGYGLMVTGPPNVAKSGIVPLDAFVRTDWLPYVFTMNWKFTEVHKVVRFKKGEPVCRIFPYPTDCGDSMELEIRSLHDDPELEERAQYWRNERASAEKEFHQNPDVDYKIGWNKNYVRGQDGHGNKQEDHKNYFECKPVVDKRNK